MKASELVLAPDGTLYHIRLQSSTLADKVLLVGDPARVNMFKEIFDSIEFESDNREIHAITGSYHGTRLTALSTGMGCDNIDIVLTELDAALHVENGTWKAESERHLQLVRIGTSGSLQADIPCGIRVASACAVGLDGLMNYYREWQPPLPGMERALLDHLQLPNALARPYCVPASARLLDAIGHDMHHGITATAPGFYGPQGRAIRLHPAIENLNEKLASFQFGGRMSEFGIRNSEFGVSSGGSNTSELRTPPSNLNNSELRSPNSELKISNLEMETSAIYGFAHLLGHEALTACLIIANRPLGTFLNDYHAQMRQLVGSVVERLAAV